MRETKILLLVGLFVIVFSTFVSGAVMVYDSGSDSFMAYEDGLFAVLPPPNMLPPSSVEELSVSEYEDLSSVDGDYYRRSLADDGEAYTLYNVSVVGVSTFNWSWRGQFLDGGSVDDSTVSFYLWNYSSSGWVSCDSNVTDTSIDVGRSCWSNNLVDFYDGNNLYFLVYASDPNDVDITQDSVLTNYVSLEVEDIEVSLVSPSNNSYNNELTNFFACNATGTSLSNLTLQVWNSTGSLVGSNVTSGSGSSIVANTSITFTYDDEYSWNCLGVDSFNSNSYADSNSTFVVDRVAPSIVEIFGGVVNGTVYDDQNGFSPSWSVSDSNIEACLLNDDPALIQGYPTACTASTPVAFPDVEGVYDYNFTVYDLAGNFNDSYLYYIIDGTAPVVSIVEPELSEVFNYNTSIELNFSVTDGVAGVDSCWYNLDGGSNVSLVSCANATFDTSDGSHTINFYSNDTVNNLRHSTRDFSVSLSVPAINLVSPSNGTYFSSGLNVYLNYTALDVDGLDTCSVWHDVSGVFVLNSSNSGVGNGTMNFSVVNASDGFHNWNVECNDSTGASGFSLNNFSFVVDETVPVVSIHSFVTTAGSQTFDFNSTIIDANTDSCKYSIYSGGSIDGLSENVSIPCDSNATATTTGFGSFTLRVYALDLAGNENFSESGFTVSPVEPGENGGEGSAGAPGGETVVLELGISTNITLLSLSGGDSVDVVLAKGSVRSRSKEFLLFNSGIEPKSVELECVSAVDEVFDICEFVSFDSDVLSVGTNEDDPTRGVFSVSVPLNASFGDKYAFNVVAKDVDGTFAKLSVTTRVPVWGVVFKYSYFPFQGVPSKSYLVFFPAFLLGFLSFFTLFFLLRKRYLLTGFGSGFASFFVVFVFGLVLL